MTEVKAFPTLSRELTASSVHVNDAGKFLITKRNCAISDVADPKDLLSNGLGYEEQGDIYDLAHNYHIAKRSLVQSKLNYFIIIPTLRCNLSCTYCQDSREKIILFGQQPRI